MQTQAPSPTDFIQGAITGAPTWALVLTAAVQAVAAVVIVVLTRRLVDTTRQYTRETATLARLAHKQLDLQMQNERRAAAARLARSMIKAEERIHDSWLPAQFFACLQLYVLEVGLIEQAWLQGEIHDRWLAFKDLYAFASVYTPDRKTMPNGKMRHAWKYMREDLADFAADAPLAERRIVGKDDAYDYVSDDNRSIWTRDPQGS